MPKTIAEIKTASNDLARRVRLGQFDEKTLVGIVNDLVNNLAVAEAAPPKRRRSFSPDASLFCGQIPAAPPKRRRSFSTPPTIEEAVVGDPVADPVGEKTTTKTLPLRVKAGRGVTVGTQSTIRTGVTVGSAPAAPAGQVTVGGRVHKS